METPSNRAERGRGRRARPSPCAGPRSRRWRSSPSSTTGRRTATSAPVRPSTSGAPRSRGCAWSTTSSRAGSTARPAGRPSSARPATSGSSGPVSASTSSRASIPGSARTNIRFGAVDDREIVARQLGRPPRAFRRVAVRCPFGRPAVTEQQPYDDEGEPFPTTYYLTCRHLVAAVSRLEAAGGVERWSAQGRAGPRPGPQPRGCDGEAACDPPRARCRPRRQ